MNAAKIQFSTGHNEDQGAGGPGIYHNIRKGWAISPEETALVTDTGWIFTKNAIIGKALALFGELSGILQTRWLEENWAKGKGDVSRQESAPGQEDVSGKEDGSEKEGMPGQMDMSGILQVPPRISKGENYKGLPWVVLDYPRCFGRDDVFAVRTLFWWGNYFSVTLHLKGRYKEMFLPVIRENLSLLDGAGFMICISDDEWRHELGQDNYRPLREGAAVLRHHAFMKFSAKCDLQDWNEAGDLLLRLSDIVIQALKA